MIEVSVIMVIMRKKLYSLVILLIISISVFMALNVINTYATPTTEDLPKVYFTGDVLTLTDKTQSKEVTMNYVDGDDSFSSNVKIKLQGTSSLAYDKKNFTITLYDSAFDKKNKVDVGMGWGSQSKYCLKANWIDSTQGRNVVSARLAAQMQKKYDLFDSAPNNGLVDGYPVEIYINDQYHGLYTWNIPKDGWMFNMDSKNDNHIIMGAENTYTNTSTTFEKLAPVVDGEDWSIEAGPNSTDEEIAVAFAKLNRVIAFIKDSTDAEFSNKQTFGQYLNLDATLNYFIFMDLSNAVDNANKNMLLATYDGQVWYPSLYDLDSTWGLYFNGEGTYNINNNCPQNYGGSTSLLWLRLLELYPKEIKDRYNELRQNVLSYENIKAEFEKFNNSIPTAAFEREHAKWTSIPSLSYGIDQIKNHAKLRGNYVDSQMIQLYLENKVYTDPSVLYNLEGTYYGDDYKFLGTNINLYDNLDSKSYTIVARYDKSGSANKTVFGQLNGATLGVDNNKIIGIRIHNNGADDGTWYALKHGNDDYEAIYNSSNYPVVVITKDTNGNYSFYPGAYPTDTGSMRTANNKLINRSITTNLVLGASYYNADWAENNLVVEDYYKGNIYNFTVYNKVLTDEEIIEKINYLNGLSSPVIELQMSGTPINQYEATTSFNKTGLTFTAKRKDDTTINVTDSVSISPSVLTPETKYVTLSYSEVDNGNVSLNIPIEVSKKGVTISGLIYEDKVYDKNPIEPAGILEYDTPSVPRSDILVLYEGLNGTEYSSTSAPSNVGNYKVTYYITEDNDTYTGSRSYTFNITKAKPSYTVPTNLKGVIGDNLSSVKLPTGFTWKTDVKIDKAGNVTYKATYTPIDVNNYNVISDIDVKIDVLNKYSLNTSVKGNLGGSISNDVTVIEGNTATIKFTPYKGYKVGNIIYGDEDVTSLLSNNSIAIKNVKKSGKIEVTYILETRCLINIVKSDGVEVEVKEGLEIVKGSNVTIKLTVKKGYNLNNFTINGLELIKDIINNEYVYRNVTDNLNVKIDATKITYKYLSGDNQSFDSNKDTNLTFKIDKELEYFDELYLDDTLVNKDNYDLESGSTIIILKENYIKTLSAGNHHLKAIFKDGGEAVTEFSLINAIDVLNNDVSDNNILKYIIIGIVTLSIIIVGTIFVKKNNGKKANN